MHLQSLELVGFKSFADKTIFQFHEGVTAIVGPNGCGKSNVLDAVRWVLGEQSAKALRGGEMADVIFNGTETRKPVGFGEVSLTFTNCESELGVDWHDVRVTRRVYRDGNSEYLLNKTPCRLRDIQSLFADTGVGRSAYSVMEQGKIDLILSSRPEDRRAVFEEAAGITKYKTQKREALRKLEATEANLLRIGDIIKEVKRQIGSLQRQAGKARRYQTLLADLQVLDTHHSRRQLDELQAEAERGRLEVARLEEAEQGAHAKIEASENEFSSKRRNLDQIDGQIGDARAEVQRLQNEISGLRNRIDFNRQRAQELEELIERYESDIAAAEAKRSEQETQIHEADALIARTNQLLEAKENEVEQLTETLQAARTERGQKEDELQSLQLSLSKFESRIATLQNELTGAAARRDATAARVAELNRAIHDETQRVTEVRADLARAQATMATEQKTAEQLRQTLRHAEEQQHQHQSTLANAEKEIGRVDRLIAEKQARLEVLRQMTEEGEGLEKGSQAVLKGLNDPDRIRPAIAGALVANLNVEREFIPALEAAFGRAMHAVVLRDTALAAEIFQTLTENKSGQAALAIPEWSADLPAHSAAEFAERRPRLGDRKGGRARRLDAHRPAFVARRGDCARPGHCSRTQEAHRASAIRHAGRRVYFRGWNHFRRKHRRGERFAPGPQSGLNQPRAGMRCARNRTADAGSTRATRHRRELKRPSARSRTLAAATKRRSKTIPRRACRFSPPRARSRTRSKSWQACRPKKARWSSRSGARTKESSNWKRNWDRSGKRSRTNWRRSERRASA